MLDIVVMVLKKTLENVLYLIIMRIHHDLPYRHRMSHVHAWGPQWNDPCQVHDKIACSCTCETKCWQELLPRVTYHFVGNYAHW